MVEEDWSRFTDTGRVEDYLRYRRNKEKDDRDRTVREETNVRECDRNGDDLVRTGKQGV